MASTLQELRKEAGYRTAKEFAVAIDVPATTYSRYEANPERIPLSAAWKIADVLGCSIDAVVGREHVEVSEMRGDFQRFYDALSPDSRRLMDAFRDFLASREESAADARRAEEERRYDEFARYYEKLFLQAAEDDPDLRDVAVFGTDDARRQAFASFLVARAQKSRDGRVTEAVVDKDFDLRSDLGLLEEREEGGIFPKRGTEEQEQRIADELDAYNDELAAAYEKHDEEVIERIMGAYDRQH